MGSGASILPFDDWFYHTDEKKRKVKKLHSQAESLSGSVKEKVLAYNHILDTAKVLVAGNAALVIIESTFRMTDEQLSDFEADVDLLPPAVSGSVPAKFGIFLSELGAGAFLLKGVVNIGKLAKNAIFSETAGELAVESVEGLGEAALEVGVEVGAEAGVEIGVEAGLEVGAEAALAETGIGIVAAIGMDAIFGAILGKKEANQLDDAARKLQDSIDKLTSAQNSITDKQKKLDDFIIKEMARFQGLYTQMRSIVEGIDGINEKLPADIPPPTPANIDEYVGLQSLAIQFFSLLVSLRTYYEHAKERNPNASKESIIHAFLISQKSKVTLEDMMKIWDVLAKYSEKMNAHAVLLATPGPFEVIYHDGKWNRTKISEINAISDAYAQLVFKGTKVYKFHANSRDFLFGGLLQHVKGKVSNGLEVIFHDGEWTRATHIHNPNLIADAYPNIVYDRSKVLKSHGDNLFVAEGLLQYFDHRGDLDNPVVSPNPPLMAEKRIASEKAKATPSRRTRCSHKK